MPFDRGSAFAADGHDISVDLASDRISKDWRIEAAGDIVAILMDCQDELIDTVDVPVVVEVGGRRGSGCGE